jgi:hypothetical protein
MLPPLIRGIDYEPAAKALTVRFAVGMYRYKGVPAEAFAAFSKAVAERGQVPDSDVLYFNRNIEGKFPSERLGP